MNREHATWHGRQWVDLSDDVMDHHILGPDGAPVGKVDDLELRTTAEGRTEVSALLVGEAALLDRLSGWTRRLLRLALRCCRGPRRPTRIELDQVTRVGPALQVNAAAAKAATSPAEQWLRQRVIRHLPGAGHASG